VPADHPDAAPLTVLGGFLRNGFLHRTIREQGGAYGGGANQDNTIAAFRFYSYRDPRLSETLADFDAALTWLQNTQHTAQSLEEAILGVVSSIDKPGSPAGEAKTTYQAELFGRTREKREQFRNRVVKVTIEDLQRVAATYLVPEKASLGVVSHTGQREKLEALGVEILSL
jgi:Zn-dependent M16 (insulinase) family peptidase